MTDFKFRINRRLPTTHIWDEGRSTFTGNEAFAAKCLMECQLAFPNHVLEIVKVG